MLRGRPRRWIPLALLVALAALSRFEAPAQTELPQPAGQQAVEQAYVGSNQCFTCHRAQVNAWNSTAHARAVANMPEPYQHDPVCLECHATAYGEPTGFIAGSEKDLSHVGCESCHGPGAQHLDAAQRFILAMPGEEAQVEQELKTSIVRTPTDAVCAECHVEQAHHRHPPYEGQPAEPARAPALGLFHSQHATVAAGEGAAPSASRPGLSRYSVKTCGGCHYDQYNDWQHDAHAAIAALLPAQYTGDQSCQQCHTNAAAPIIRAAAASGEPGPTWVGTSCENCHGPGYDHIRFNRQFIGPVPLTAGQEQAARASIHESKPAATCIQCHATERHQSHPTFNAT